MYTVKDISSWIISKGLLDNVSLILNTVANLIIPADFMAKLPEQRQTIQGTYIKSPKVPFHLS